MHGWGANEERSRPVETSPQFTGSWQCPARTGAIGGLAGGAGRTGQCDRVSRFWPCLPGFARRQRHGSGRKSAAERSEEHTSELQSLMRISYAVFCLKKKKPIHHPLCAHRVTHTSKRQT